MNRAAEPYLRVSQVVNGFTASRVLHMAVDLDLFTSLANEGKTAAQLSSHLDVQPEALELLLNALTSLGFLRKESERFFDTPVSHTYLSRSGPKYMGHLIRHQARSWSAWGRLMEALQTGKPVCKPVPIDKANAELEDFIRGMHELALARGDARWLARVISLVRCRTLLDLGGGPGTYAALFCRANPQLEATVVDLPATLEITRRILREFDLTGRVQVQAADYRSEKIPGGPYDVALLSNILHAETEATNLQLLRNVYEVLSPGALVMVKDHVMSGDHTEPQNGALFALEMLLTTDGRTYSFDEISRWLQRAGFTDTTELPLDPPSPVSLVLALRPGKRALVLLPRPAAKREPAAGAVASSLPPAAPFAPATKGAAPSAAAGTTLPAQASPRAGAQAPRPGATRVPSPSRGPARGIHARRTRAASRPRSRAKNARPPRSPRSGGSSRPGRSRRPRASR
ncbi:MAG TPA: methyltransferase [Candidatus Krumholzibacteria bacterium]|nr:methyltransferase [Candidatus Krumholzibacteria bacterium]